ncbi:MAG: TIGR03862 family flavoprotein [Bacteroidota bacterium]|nr:TIGR03862 family flavoprotein [Bacteroidota bacterium]
MKQKVAIVGGGPSALMLAATLDFSKFEVGVYEQNKTLGRKFLVAGDGGFNLTHGSDIELMKQQYHPSGFLDKALETFSNNDLRNWLRSLSIDTFVGSSNRVYPIKGIKPIQVLNTILQKLEENKVNVRTQMQWNGWMENNDLLFNETEVVKADKVIFALGGASWSITGSKGTWLPVFQKKGIATLPFQASNCAFKVDWQSEFIDKYNGFPIKNISLTLRSQSVKGELVITKFGLEGNAIYALSRVIQNELKQHGQATVYLDLKPMFTLEQVKEKLKKKESKNTTETLKMGLNLSAMTVQLLKQTLNKEDFTHLDTLAEKIKSLPISLLQAAPIEEAISTTGGIAIEEVDENFQLKKMPNHYVIGEMLDWDAPTGGYLLQACMCMGVVLGKWLNETN